MTLNYVYEQKTHPICTKDKIKLIYLFHQFLTCNKIVSFETYFTVT